MAEGGIGRSVLLSIIGTVIAATVGLIFAYVHNWLGITKGGERIAHPDDHPADRPGTVPDTSIHKRTFKGPVEFLSAMSADLEKLDPTARSRRRYLTLTHLHNNSTWSNADLDRFRTALGELAGHMSPERQALTWQAVDADRTIFAIDLGELRWEAGDLWQELLRHYPYGVTYSRVADSAWRDAEKRLQELSGTKLPFVRADWFLTAMVRPPFAGADGVWKAPKRAVPESVQKQVQAYIEDRLTLDGVAADLARNEPRHLEAFLRDNAERRRQLHLDALLQPGGTIRRTDWEQVRDATTSPFQEVTQGLHYGTPLVFQ
jgi:hypothetical protein